MKRTHPDSLVLKQQKESALHLDDVIGGSEFVKDEEDGVIAAKNKKKNSNEAVPTARAQVNQAILLQTETNDLLKQIVSQNNIQIKLLNDLIKKFE